MNESTRRPVFMIPTEGKTDEQLADEVWEAVQRHRYTTGQPHEHVFDNPAGTCIVCGYND